jgi:predicted CXXCH cytochrome family protein
MFSSDILGANLQSSHPFSFNKLQDSPDLVASIVQSKQTADPLNLVKLFGGNVACESCHNPHVENVDSTALNFMVRNNTGGGLCLSCHGTTLRTVNNMPNPLVPWPISVHATVSNATLPAAYVGVYNTVAQNACSSCHVEHNANSPARLLRGTNPPVATMDASTQNCITCHNGNKNIIPALPNVYAESTKSYAHPFPSGKNLHDTAEPVLLNNDRHATCVDCHNPHGALQAGSVFPLPPQIRNSQAVVNGVMASDGVSVLSPALNQYDNCLRCHGTSTG